MEHADPEQGERGDVLRQRTGIAGAGDAFGDAGVVEGFKGLAGEAAVAGDGVGDDGLDTRVADVLELLVVGRVGEGLMGFDLRGAPGDVPDFGEVGGQSGIGGGAGGVEFGAHLEGISGEVSL